MKVLLLDPSLEPQNSGDKIISEAIQREIHLAGIELIGRISTHDRLTRFELSLVRQADVCIVGGTNLLVSKFYSQWNLGLREVLAYRNKCVLLGCGWWKYQDQPSILMRIIYRMILNKQFTHSVRDEYSKNQLKSISRKVINTSCPTMWEIPSPKTIDQKQTSVIVTLTDYSKDPVSDAKLLSLARTNFTKVYFWPQGDGDFQYFKSLNSQIEVLDAGLDSLRSKLKSGALYFGTRLHAGILALQMGRPALIVGIDNRAIEIARDTGLNITSRESLFSNQTLNFSFVRPAMPLMEIYELRKQMKGWS